MANQSRKVDEGNAGGVEECDSNQIRVRAAEIQDFHRTRIERSNKLAEWQNALTELVESLGPTWSSQSYFRQRNDEEWNPRWYFLDRPLDLQAALPHLGVVIHERCRPYTHNCQCVRHYQCREFPDNQNNGRLDRRHHCRGCFSDFMGGIFHTKEAFSLDYDLLRRRLLEWCE
jgi:hypothetical protein